MARAIGDFAIAQDWIAPSQAAERLAQLEPRLRELDRLWTEIAKADARPLPVREPGTCTPARRGATASRSACATPRQKVRSLAHHRILSIAQAAGERSRFPLGEHAQAASPPRLQNTYGLASFVLRPMGRR
ncbi:MAG: hypothetical protein R3E96_10795 [Planctomycetota bacterium]